MLAIALLGLLIAALTALFAKRTGRLAGVGHAWREATLAGFRHVERVHRLAADGTLIRRVREGPAFRPTRGGACHPRITVFRVADEGRHT